ncbi:hypothetical protein [Paenibacillus thalictri]|uniref:hypothetical protein n=1 Tax=Paenibacillus thalictri TaxID=2527873 RepID=UPI001F113B58|nr:hypothetical protein [Paenibacillus thalictri]
MKVIGEERFADEIQKTLKNGEYRSLPARRKEIPKADGKMRPLGIPTIRDRVVQIAMKMVLERSSKPTSETVPMDSGRSEANMGRSGISGEQ